MIRERGVSYYGVMSLDRARQDFDEMLEHGCNAILFAVSEFDWWFWKKSVCSLISEAHNHGLKTYVDLWGWGKTLAGEPPSLFLMRDTEHRQQASSGKIYPSVCLNYEGFQEFLRKSIREIASEIFLDGFFWDEPHYANWNDPDWACRCPICTDLYKKEFGKQMPRELTSETISFREQQAVKFLTSISRAAKETNPRIDVTVCLLPTESPLIGITDWDRVASIPEVDILATDPYWFHAGLDRLQGLEFFRKIGGKAVELSKRKGKRSQLWLQAFRVPRGRESELREAAKIADELGVDSLFAWPYRGGEGSILESDDARTVWRLLGESFREVSR